MTDSGRINTLENQVAELTKTVDDLKRQLASDLDGKKVVAALRHDVRIQGSGDLKQDLGLS